MPEQAGALVNETAVRSPIYIDARDIAAAKIVAESNVFIPFALTSSEKQISRFITPRDKSGG
jgi:hypothetical protein